MPRISATFNKTITKITEQYSLFHDITFSSAVEILTSVTALEWWGKLTKAQKKELDAQLEEKRKNKKP